MKKTLLIVAFILFAFCLTGAAGGNVKKSALPGSKGTSFLTFNNAGLSLGEDDDSYTDLMKKKKKRKKGKGKKGGGAAFDQGNVVVSLGYGMPNLTKSVYKAYESFIGYKVTGFGPMHIKFEYGVSEKFGVGLSVNTVSTKVSWTDTYEDWVDTAYVETTYESGVKFNAIAFNIRGNYHFVNTDKLDVYGGLGLGYNNSKSEFYSDDPDALVLSVSAFIPLGLEFSVGTRYFFTDNIGAYIECGLAKSVIQGGLSIKF